MKLKKGDEVQVIRGKDKGKKGKVERAFPKEDKVEVIGVNQYKRHIKARSLAMKSEIVTLTKPLNVANVRLICPKCHVATRVGYVVNDGKKRKCKKCDQII